MLFQQWKGFEATSAVFPHIQNQEEWRGLISGASRFVLTVNACHRPGWGSSNTNPEHEVMGPASSSELVGCNIQAIREPCSIRDQNYTCHFLSSRMD